MGEHGFAGLFVVVLDHHCRCDDGVPDHPPDTPAGRSAVVRRSGPHGAGLHRRLRRRRNLSVARLLGLLFHAARRVGGDRGAFPELLERRAGQRRRRAVAAAPHPAPHWPPNDLAAAPDRRGRRGLGMRLGHRRSGRRHRPVVAFRDASPARRRRGPAPTPPRPGKRQTPAGGHGTAPPPDLFDPVSRTRRVPITAYSSKTGSGTWWSAAAPPASWSPPCRGFPPGRRSSAPAAIWRGFRRARRAMGSPFCTPAIR